MRIGIVGAGIIGDAHCGRLADTPGVDELVVADAVPEAAGAMAARHPGCRPVPIDDILKQVDGVVVTTNTAGHAEWIKKAVDAEVPVFCEKPVSTGIVETLDVVRHCEGHSTPVQIGFQRRFDAGYRRAKDLHRRGVFGSVHTLRATTMDELPPPEAYIRNQKSGGLFKDNSVHDFDIISWILGSRAETVYALGGNKGPSFFAESNDFDSTSAVVRYEDGTLATVSASRISGAGHDVRLEIFGELTGGVVGLEDRLALNSLEERVSWLRREPWHTYNQRFDTAYRAELEYFVTSVASGQHPSPCTPQDALEAVTVAEAATESARTGRPVDVAELRLRSGGEAA